MHPWELLRKLLALRLSLVVGRLLAEDGARWEQRHRLSEPASRAVSAGLTLGPARLAEARALLLNPSRRA